ncbi:MAG TPA: glycosyltransferase family 4 protein [Candidatus Paceibacterota bacterium]
MKIFYIITGRYPTERAYGIQIEKTAEALRNLGAEVVVKAPPAFLQFLLRLGQVGYHLRTLIFLLFLPRHSGSITYTRDSLAAYLTGGYLELHDITKGSLSRKAAFRADGVIVISKGLRDRLIELGVPADKILVAPDGVDLKDFDIAISKAQARKQFNLPLDKKIVLYVGLFDEWKGYKTLLEASKQFGSDTELVMAGGREEQVANLSKEYQHVKFLGWTDYAKLPALQKVADVLVLPNSAQYEISRTFTSPLKLFAYMASGVPIVASDLPSIREVLDDDSAFFVTPDDPTALASAAGTALADPDLGQRLASRALQLVQRYAWQSRARAILDFLQKYARDDNHPNI